MVTQRFQIAQALRSSTDSALEHAAGPLVQLGTAGEKEVLVGHFVHERVREPVAVAVAAILPDQIGLGETG